MLKDTFVSPVLSIRSQGVVPGQCCSTVSSTVIVVNLEKVIFDCTGDDHGAEGWGSEDEDRDEGAHRTQEVVAMSPRPYEQYLYIRRDS